MTHAERFWRKPPPPPVVTTPIHKSAATFSAAMKELYVAPIRDQLMIGNTFTIPIKSYKPGWNQAVEWLEAREAAKQEWPWPS